MTQNESTYISRCHNAPAYEDGKYMRCGKCKEKCSVKEEEVKKKIQRGATRRPGRVLVPDRAASPEITPQYQRLMEWVATPRTERVPQKLEDLAKELKVHRVTLWEWMKRDHFRQTVIEGVRKGALDKVSDVVKALYIGCVERRRQPEIELFLKYAAGWVPKEIQQHEVIVYKWQE